MTADRDFEDEETAAAAAEAAGIGGVVDDYEGVDESDRAVSEGGGGESEGFELAEQELVDHASHGDQHTPDVVLRDAGASEESNPGRVDSEPDAERSSEVE